MNPDYERNHHRFVEAAYHIRTMLALSTPVFQVFFSLMMLTIVTACGPAMRAPKPPQGTANGVPLLPQRSSAGPVVIVDREERTGEEEVVGSVRLTDRLERFQNINDLIAILERTRTAWQTSNMAGDFPDIVTLAVRPGISGRSFVYVYERIARTGFSTINVTIGSKYYETWAHLPGPSCGTAENPCSLGPPYVLHVQADEQFWRLRVPLEDRALEGSGPASSVASFRAAVSALLARATVGAIVIHVAPDVSFSQLAPFLAEAVDLTKSAALTHGVTISGLAFDPTQGSGEFVRTSAESASPVVPNNGNSKMKPWLNPPPPPEKVQEVQTLIEDIQPLLLEAQRKSRLVNQMNDLLSLLSNAPMEGERLVEIIKEVRKLIEESTDLIRLITTSCQSAIDKVITVYQVDTSAAKSIKCALILPAQTAGQTISDRSVKIGLLAFSSPGYLAVTISHEAEVHARQLQAGFKIGKPGEVRNTLLEISACDWMIGNANRFGLSADERQEFMRLRMYYYNMLPRHYKQRVDKGIMTEF